VLGVLPRAGSAVWGERQLRISQDTRAVGCWLGDGGSLAGKTRQGEWPEPPRRFNRIGMGSGVPVLAFASRRDAAVAIVRHAGFEHS
jgi:hypothetical protein